MGSHSYDDDANEGRDEYNIKLHGPKVTGVSWGLAWWCLSQNLHHHMFEKHIAAQSST